MWSLSRTASYFQSLGIQTALQSAAYRPEPADSPELYDNLARYLKPSALRDSGAAKKFVPPAVRLASLKVAGRVNNFSFAPNLQTLAIASSQRQVVEWNFHTAQIERVIRGFNRSVGLVEYGPDGTLWAAEKTTGSDACQVMAIKDGAQTILGSHYGSITVLYPLFGSQVLTIGKDNRICIWDGANQRLVSQRALDYWPRSYAVSPDQSILALFTNRLHLFRLPGLEPVKCVCKDASPEETRKGKVVSCSFSPDGSILAGQYNGDLVQYTLVSSNHYKSHKIAGLNSPVHGLLVAENPPRVLVGWGQGVIQFLEPPYNQAGPVIRIDPDLTTLEISTGQSFLAVGKREGGLEFWDLRTGQILPLLQKPAAAFDPQQFALLRELEKELQPSPLDDALQYMLLLLHERFQYDIQVSALPSIKPGEFDLVIDAGGDQQAEDEPSF